MQQGSTPFIYNDTSYFFSFGEIVDYYLGKEKHHALQVVLSKLEQQKVQTQMMLSLFAEVCQENDGKVEISDRGVGRLIDNDGVKLLFGNLSRHLQRMQEKDGDNLGNQLSLKIMINIIYICCDYLERNPTHKTSSAELNQVYKDENIDDLLMKMITLSLQVHYIPVKKLTMLYTKVLANVFHHGVNSNSPIDPINIFNLQELTKLPQNNLLKMNQLQKVKVRLLVDQKRGNKDKITSVQKFYRKHNTGECPLAQSIVVGLLRSLLTICNCQTHKKFITTRGGGVDSFRQWQLSYRWLLSKSQFLACVPISLINRLQSYELFDQQPTADSEIWSQFYCHKIYTTASITTFFFLLLLGFKHNQCLQYSYFLQLISDANGILVFLKFLTDKFANLDLIIEQKMFSNKREEGKSLVFKEKVMMTIHSVLLMLYASCNNYPQKIRNYLFEYNSYLIIKKIPGLFMGKDRLRMSLTKDQESSEAGPSSSLPSRKEMEELEREVGGSEVAILRQLTQLCFDLLKVQIPFFSKKMKQNSANMRLIIDLYCKFPKDVKPQKLTSLDKLILKSKCCVQKPQKLITSVEQMKTMHNEYNNTYYWNNDFGQEESPPSVRLLENSSPLGDPETWLQENMWKYYD